MKLTDFVLMTKGFWDRRKYEQHIVRRLAYITRASMVSKPLHPNKIWPIDDVESKPVTKEELKARSEEVMRRLKVFNETQTRIKEEKRKKNGK